jgi:hypothetical protein
LDALSPVDLRETVEYHIKHLISWPEWEASVRVQTAEQESIEDIISKWPKSISALDAKYPAEPEA